MSRSIIAILILGAAIAFIALAAFLAPTPEETLPGPTVGTTGPVPVVVEETTSESTVEEEATTEKETLPDTGGHGYIERLN